MITLCDLNKSLIKKAKKLKGEIEFKAVCGDIFEYQKKNGGLIATASNPSFNMGGGLDGKIAKRFPEEVKQAKEFMYTDNLFFTVTVDNELKSSREIIKRALAGCYAYRSINIIISGFGTGIGGLDEDIFIEELECIINADLRHANLGGADLGGANLGYADLGGANLRGANLGGANLRGANLRGANLGGANLRGADLRGADLVGANLGGANLRGADLRHANLGGADLRGADLGGANLGGANLRGADLRGAETDNVIVDERTCFFSLQCPEEGSFIGWKKCRDGKIVKLLITEKAKRSSATTRKCRASEVVVLEIDGKKTGIAVSLQDEKFIYKVGKTIKIKDFDEDRWNECSSGIHFFITKKESINY